MSKKLIPKNQNPFFPLVKKLEENDLSNIITYKASEKITPEKVAKAYLDHVVYIMENPTNKNFRNGLYYPYEDLDKNGKVHKNIGPGIESTSDIAVKNKLDYSGKTGYTKEYLDSILYPDLVKKAKEIDNQLVIFKDQQPLGNKLILLDIAHNVIPTSGNMPHDWPALVQAMYSNDIKKIKKNTRSGSNRRMHMRNMLINKTKIDNSTVQNK